jgi:hypothetical protein
MSRFTRRVARAFAVLGLIVAVLAAVGLVVQLLWNALIPSVFHGPVLLYGQAVGLLVLCRILFGGLRMRGGRGHWRGAQWRERWERMSPQERAQLRERFRSRCGGAAGEEAAAGG